MLLYTYVDLLYLLVRKIKLNLERIDIMLIVCYNMYTFMNVCMYCMYCMNEYKCDRSFMQTIALN